MAISRTIEIRTYPPSLLLGPDMEECGATTVPSNDVRVKIEGDKLLPVEFIAQSTALVHSLYTKVLLIDLPHGSAKGYCSTAMRTHTPAMQPAAASRLHAQ